MLRTVMLVILNVSLALLLAVSLVPVMLVLAPELRAEPAAGYTALTMSTATFVVINAWLWRRWRRR